MLMEEGSYLELTPSEIDFYIHSATTLMHTAQLTTWLKVELLKFVVTSVCSWTEEYKSFIAYTDAHL